MRRIKQKFIVGADFFIKPSWSPNTTLHSHLLDRDSDSWTTVCANFNALIKCCMSTCTRVSYQHKIIYKSYYNPSKSASQLIFKKMTLYLSSEVVEDILPSLRIVGDRSDISNVQRTKIMPHI